jgi:DNA-binding transcriptional LysR family regulator
MVLAGMGFAVMPEYSVTHPDVVVRPLVNPMLKRQIALLHSASGEPLQQIQRFVETACAFAWPG